MRHTQHHISPQDHMPCAKAFSNKYTTKYITGPISVDNLAPVTSQAISSQATSLEIDIPTFDDTDGPIRYYILSLVNVYCY